MQKFGRLGPIPSLIADVTTFIQVPQHFFFPEACIVLLSFVFRVEKSTVYFSVRTYGMIILPVL